MSLKRLTSRYSQRAQAPVADLKRSANKMKIPAAPLLFLLFAGCSSVPIDEASARHVIVPASEQDGVFFVDADWTPDERMIALAEKEIGRLFARPDSRMKGLVARAGSAPPRKAPFRLSDYNVRYCAVTTGGERQIIGRGAHRDLGEYSKYLLRPAISRPPPAPIPGQPFETPLRMTIGGGGTYVFTAIFEAETMGLLELSYAAGM